MKLIDNIIVKYGMDKVLHFLGGLSISSTILMIFAILNIHFAISTIFAFVTIVCKRPLILWEASALAVEIMPA